MVYADRKDAGRQLAKALGAHKNKDVVVLALPRGGVVLGAEVARILGAPLGLVLVRKIGHPSNPEYAIGAIAENNRPVYDQAALGDIGKTWLELEEEAARELIEQRREFYYNSGSSYTHPEIKGKTVIIIDDGIATGLTMRAAVQSVQKQGAKRIIVAAPVASREAVGGLKKVADEVIVLDDPATFKGSVGAHYKIFHQVPDEDVRGLLMERGIP